MKHKEKNSGLKLKTAIKIKIFFHITFIILFASFILMQPVSSQITEEQKYEFVFEKDKELILCSLYEGTIDEMRTALDSGLITCTDLTKYYLNRISLYNEKYNCFISFCDNAIDEAIKRDEAIKNGTAQGILWGIPIVVKDNMDVKGYQTTNGYNGTFKKASENADVVESLLAQGAVIIGKTNMSTGAQSARSSVSRAAGQTYNAYSTSLSSGGSSGGTAVAVSLNFAAAGIGSDTNSSLRIPATLNGDVALRPTKGLLSTNGICALNSSRDVPGPITRTVKDCAIMMDALTDLQYSYTENLDSNTLQGARLGLVSELTYKKSADSEVVALVENAVSELESLGAEIVVISFPEAASGNATYSKYQKILEEYDLCALIYPNLLSAPLSAYPKSESEEFLNNSYALSPVLKIPEIVFPIGRHSNGGGISLALSSLRNSEQLLLNLAYSYTESYNHRASPEGVSNETENDPALTVENAIKTVEYRILYSYEYKRRFSQK